jgi:hypothetical protein
MRELVADKSSSHRHKADGDESFGTWGVEGMLVVARSVPAVLRPVHAPNAQVVTAKSTKEAKEY